MSDYDSEFHKCLDKAKAIRNKLNKRSENMANNQNNVYIDTIIKDALEDFSEMIQNLKSLTNAGNPSNQEISRRNENNKKVEEMFLQLRQQIEINQVKINVRFT